MKYADYCCTACSRQMSLSHPMVQHKCQHGGRVRAALAEAKKGELF